MGASGVRWRSYCDLILPGLAIDMLLAKFAVADRASMNGPELINFIVTTFALLNPLGILPIFIGLTAR